MVSAGKCSWYSDTLPSNQMQHTSHFVKSPPIRSLCALLTCCLAWSAACPAPSAALSLPCSAFTYASLAVSAAASYLEVVAGSCRVRRCLDKGLLALVYRRIVGAHKIVATYDSAWHCRCHNAPLGRLVLGRLLGLLRLVGRQANGSGRSVQQALALHGGKQRCQALFGWVEML